MIIQSRRVWIVNTWVQAQIEMENGIISNIYEYGKKEVDKDYGNKRIIPGFIDIHTHGMLDFDTNDGNSQGLRNWIKEVTKEGVTAFCPTTITQSEDVLTRALKNVAQVIKEGYQGAEILGIHLEGPYIDKKFKGAQPEEFCVPANLEQFKRYEKASSNHIKIVTMACEHDINFELTKYCVSKGIVVSLGHSSATFDQAQMAIAYGASSMTHVHNGMSSYHHREPGLVGAALRFSNVYGEIIGDGCHVSQEVLYNFYQAKGKDHAILVSDSSLMKGLEIGSIRDFGGQQVQLYPDGTAHLVEGKALASSTLRINEGLKRVVEQAGVSWQKAINSCTLNPARLLKVDHRKGSIQVGKDGDIVVLNDDYSVKMTYIKGKEAFL